MSLFNNLMDFVKSVTVLMLSNATNAPMGKIGTIANVPPSPPPEIEMVAPSGGMINGSPVLILLSTAGMFEGEMITGDGVPDDTTILSVDNETKLTMSQNATKTKNSGTVIVGEPQNIAPLNYTDSPGVLKYPHSDYAFYLIIPDDEHINKQMDIDIEATDDPSVFNRITTYVRNFRIIWQTYGDDGLEWADTIRIMLYDPDIMALFAEQGITLITEINAPVFIPEAINQQWFHRYDVFARFNQMAKMQVQIPVISEAAVTIKDSEGVV